MMTEELLKKVIEALTEAYKQGKFTDAEMHDIYIRLSSFGK